MLIKSFYLFLFCSSTFACSVPVFRYALEYWKPDSYQIILKHSSSQTNRSTAIFNEINKYKSNRSFSIKKVKVSKNNEQIILRYPSNTRIKTNA